MLEQNTQHSPLKVYFLFTVSDFFRKTFSPDSNVLAQDYGREKFLSLWLPGSRAGWGLVPDRKGQGSRANTHGNASMMHPGAPESVVYQSPEWIPKADEIDSPP